MSTNTTSVVYSLTPHRTWKAVKGGWLLCELSGLASGIFTARNEVGTRLCFYTCLWFCSRGGGSAPLHAGIHPSPWTRGRHIPTLPPSPHTHTQRSACWEIRATSGRYASYWNANLLLENDFSGKYFFVMIDIQISANTRLRISKSLAVLSINLEKHIARRDRMPWYLLTFKCNLKIVLGKV